MRTRSAAAGHVAEARAGRDPTRRSGPRSSGRVSLLVAGDRSRRRPARHPWRDERRPARRRGGRATARASPATSCTSVSTKATSGVVTAPSPALRATAGPALVRRRRTLVPSIGATGGSDASSTTMTVATPGQQATMSRSVAGVDAERGHDDGDVAQRRADEHSGRGWIAPASSSRSTSFDGPTSSPAAIRSNARDPGRASAGTAAAGTADRRRRRRAGGSSASSSYRRHGGARSQQPCVDGGDELVAQQVEQLAPSPTRCAPVGSPRTPLGLTARTPAGAQPRASSASGSVAPGRGAIRRARGRDAIASTNDVSVRPAWASPPGTSGHHVSTRDLRR